MSDNAESGRQVQRIGAYGVSISESNEILLSRFSRSPDGCWSLPGGGVEHGEDPADAVVRELAEETGYDVEVERLLSVESSIWQIPDGTHVHGVNILYEVDVIGGELANEIDGGSDLAAWFSLVEALKLPRVATVDVALARRKRR